MMINLLPPQQKEALKKEEDFRLVLILGFLLLVFLTCLSLILFALNVYLAGEVEVQEILFEQREAELKNPQMQTLQKNLLSLNKILIQLDSFYQSQFDSTDVLEKISNALPFGTRLTNLSLISETDKELTWRATCNLSGFSPNRTILLKFKENLEREENFQEIYFPPTNWVQPENINFLVKFKVK